jgi:hypothetical protein
VPILEVVFRAELNDATRVRTYLDLTKCPRTNCVDWETVVCVVEKIEELKTQTSAGADMCGKLSMETFPI